MPILDIIVAIVVANGINKNVQLENEVEPSRIPIKNSN